MKKVSTSEFINVLKNEVANIKVSGTKSIKGQFGAVTYLVGNVLKNSYYAKNQADKTDKNPLWGRNITAIKEYSFQVATDYGTQREKDGYELSEDYVSPFESIIPNLIFQHKETGAYYIQVMSKARQSTFFLDNVPMSTEELDSIKPYKKPYKETGKKSDDYKKLSLSKVVSISLNGETYQIDDNVTYVTIEKPKESTIESK